MTISTLIVSAKPLFLSGAVGGAILLAIVGFDMGRLGDRRNSR